MLSEKRRAYLKEYRKRNRQKFRDYWNKWWDKKRIKEGRPEGGTEEWRRAISEATKGEKHWNWKGGVTPENKSERRSKRYREWRLAVFLRDGFKCVWCGDERGGNLEADHIKPFALFVGLRYELSNGRTLCKSCHKKTDTYGTQPSK